MRTSHCVVLALLSALSIGALHAADPAQTGEDRLREALRDTMIQLRSAQADLAGLQASQATLADDKKAATEKYEALKKQVAAERMVSDKSEAALTVKVAEQQTAIGHLNEELSKSKAEGETVAAAAHAAEARGDKLKTENILLQRRLTDLESKNLALFLIGNQILSRYEDFGLGNAISAKEPFVSRTRTKLENLVQDYEDQLLDQRAQK